MAKRQRSWSPLLVQKNVAMTLERMKTITFSLIHSGKACIGAPIYFFFELGTDRLLNKSQLVNLDEVARIAKKYGLKVKVIGAADSATGSETINDNLSRSRARFIAEELMKRGMESGTISQIFDGGIDDYSPNEANRHTRILLYL